ncbi:hypothetical protein MY11210_009722 [Beauveria gryllotalpidicola]
MPPHILHNAQMLLLYNEAKGYEPYSVRFWNALLNQDFTFNEQYVVAPEQLVHLDLRNGRDRVDTVVEHFKSGAHRYFMIHEAKRESQNAEELEAQALGYAAAIVKERRLGTLLVLTTIGVTFRTWFITHDDIKLRPFSNGGSRAQTSYLSVDTTEGDYTYVAFMNAVKESTRLPNAPTLYSSTPDIDMSTASPPTDVVTDSSGSPSETGSNSSRDCIFGTGELTQGGEVVAFYWTDSEENDHNIKTRPEKWKFDERTRHMTYYSRSLNQRFAFSNF